MVESEEKRKKLKGIVARWCKHTNHPNLREGDIGGLVEGILGEFYHITLCCGHMVRELNEGVHIQFEDFITDRSDMEHGGGMGIVSGTYCRECAEKYKKEPGAWEVEEKVSD